MSELSVLKNIVRTGWVSSVNEAERTARVTFRDKGQEPIVSGNLKVLKNPPFIPAKNAPQRTEEESGGGGLCLPQSRRHNQTVATVSGRLCALYLPSDG